MSSISVREGPGVLVVHVEEATALNDFRSSAFRDEMYETIGAYPVARVALDLAKIDFLSSSGVALLVGLKRRLDAQQGKLVLFNLHPIVHDLLRVIRLTQYFSIAGDEPAAIEALRPSPTA